MKASFINPIRTPAARTWPGAPVLCLPCKCQSSLLTQRELLLGLGRSWGCAVKKVRNVRPAPHLQALGNPFQAHGRLLPEPPSNGDLAPVPFALVVQVRFYPAQTLISSAIIRSPFCTAPSSLSDPQLFTPTF